MRKTSYALAFLAVAATFVLNILSLTRPDWLVVETPEVLHTKIIITYGLSRQCQQTITRISGPNNGKLEYSDYECRDFPMKVKDGCEEEYGSFCTAWSSARYFEEIAAWSAGVTLLAIGFGASTGSRRRRVWRVVAGLVMVHAIFQIFTFGIITDLYSSSRFTNFENARIGAAYVLNIVTWILSVFITIAVITTGISAAHGHRWAAGNRAYTSIPDA